LANLALPLVRFHKDSGVIMLSKNYNFTIYEKLILYAIGKYFIKEYGLAEDFGFGIEEMKEATRIPKKTSISKYKDKAIVDKIIQKDKYGVYRINILKIESKLSEIREKYKVMEN